jgi:hypothetical protein
MKQYYWIKEKEHQNEATNLAIEQDSNNKLKNMVFI